MTSWRSGFWRQNMLKFPKISEHDQVPAGKTTLEDYVQFCLFCVENNPTLTAANNLRRKSEEKNINVPFRLPG